MRKVPRHCLKGLKDFKHNLWLWHLREAFSKVGTQRKNLSYTARTALFAVCIMCEACYCFMARRLSGVKKTVQKVKRIAARRLIFASACWHLNHLSNRICIVSFSTERIHLEKYTFS